MSEFFILFGKLLLSISCPLMVGFSNTIKIKGENHEKNSNNFG